MTASAIFTGNVAHMRFLPKKYGFHYRVFMLYLDLDELPTVFDGIKGWSVERSNIASFKRANYYGDPNQPLKTEIIKLVQAKTGKVITGPVRLLTNLSYFGYCFNPVSFYYCYAADGQTLQAIVSHITNTPWGEDYAYVHDCAVNERDKPQLEDAQLDSTQHFAFQKQFHVSPFMPMDIDYAWQFKTTETQRFIHMKNLKQSLVEKIDSEKTSSEKTGAEKTIAEKTRAEPVNTELFNATMQLARQPLTQQSLNQVLLRYPFMTFKVIGAIYWHALRLWLKGVTFHDHP